MVPAGQELSTLVLGPCRPTARLKMRNAPVTKRTLKYQLSARIIKRFCRRGLRRKWMRLRRAGVGFIGLGRQRACRCGVFRLVWKEGSCRLSRMKRAGIVHRRCRALGVCRGFISEWGVGVLA